MAQMTKAFAESLLERVRSGHHINTTCWEEEQLLVGWLKYHDEIYAPRMEALAKTSAAEAGPATFGAAAGSLSR